MGAAPDTASCDRVGRGRQDWQLVGALQSAAAGTAGHGLGGSRSAHSGVPSHTSGKNAGLTVLPARMSRRRSSLLTTAMALALTATGGQLAAAENNGAKTAPPTQQAAAAGPTDASVTLDPDVATTLQQQQQMLQEQARQLDAQARMLAKQQEMLRQQQLQINALQQQSAPGIKPATLTVPRVGSGWYYPAQEVVPVPPDTGETPTPVPPDTGETPTPVPPTAGTETPEAPSPDAGAAAEEQRPESKKATDQLLLERGAILLPAGTLQVEPSIEYSHISANQIAISGFTIFDAIVIGNIEVDDLSRDIATAALSARFGVLDRLQIEGRVPYLYRRDEEIFGFGTNNQDDFSSSNNGLGDVEAGVSYQLLIGDGEAIPDVIVRGHGRFPTGEDPFEIATVDLGNNRSVLEEPPTGSGFYGVGGGATLVWRVDPVVFFAGGDATINLKRTINTAIGEIDPGDTYQGFGGVNVQLSELVSLNLSFVDQFTTESEQNGIALVGSDLNDARLVLGTAVGVGQNASLTFNAAAGLTKESPDFVFTVSLPISFSLF